MDEWNRILATFSGLVGRPNCTRARRVRRSRRATTFEVLENRSLLTVTNPIGINGLAFPDSDFSVPPDTSAAAGPNQIVEVVNSTVAFFDKTTGNRISQELLDSFFGFDLSACNRSSIFDPKTSYDELAQRFVVIVLAKDPCVKESHLLVAVSDDNDPAGSWEMHDLVVTDTSEISPLQTTWGDFPGLGRDADAIYVSMNMYTWRGDYDHVRIITVDKGSVLDGEPDTFTHFDVTRSDPHITMQPAVMHGASSGDPMFFVEEAGFANGSRIRIVKMTDKLSATPTFTDADIAVASYTFPPKATQPGSTRLRLKTNDTSILNADWRGGRIVAAQNVGLARRKEAHVRWYEFNTNTMTLTQQGTIDPGPRIHTYYPSIAIAANGDLGLAYMQSSKQEFMSVYGTGQRSGGTPGVMETPILLKAGDATYTEFGHPPFRTGDYSSIVVDPVTGNSFWAANEYATSATRDNWGTWIASISLSP